MSGTHREWQLDLAKIDLRDDTVEAVCQRRVAGHRDRRKIGKGEKLEYQEIDVSQNRITWHGLRAILDMSLQCMDLRVVKLFKNELTDQAAPSLCRLVEECRGLEQLHLSYNRLSAAGAKEVLTTAHTSRRARQLSSEARDKGKPGFTLWLRLEHNRIKNSAGLLEELRELKVDFCEARDSTKCGPRMCKNCAAIHLPYLSKQDVDPCDATVTLKASASATNADPRKPKSPSQRPPPPGLPGQARAANGAAAVVRGSPSGSPRTTCDEDGESAGSASASSASPEVIDIIDIEASPPPSAPKKATLTPASPKKATLTPAAAAASIGTRAVASKAKATPPREFLAKDTAPEAVDAGSTSRAAAGKVVRATPQNTGWLVSAAPAPKTSAVVAAASAVSADEPQAAAAMEVAVAPAVDIRARTSSDVASKDGASSEAAEPMATTDPYALDIELDLDEAEVFDCASPTELAEAVAKPEDDEPEAADEEELEVTDCFSPTDCASPSDCASPTELGMPPKRTTPAAKLAPAEKSEDGKASKAAGSKAQSRPPSTLAKASPSAASSSAAPVKATGSKDPDAPAHKAAAKDSSVAPRSSRSRSRPRDTGLKQAAEGQSHQRTRSTGADADAGANHKADGHHRRHEKKSKKEKGDKKRREISEGSVASEGRRSRSRKRRRHHRDREGADAKTKDGKEAKAASEQSGNNPVAGILGMKPSQLSKKTPKDPLAAVKEAFGLADEDAAAKERSKEQPKETKQETKAADSKTADTNVEASKVVKDSKEHRHKHKKDKHDSKEPKDSKEAKSQKTSKEPKESKEEAKEPPKSNFETPAQGKVEDPQAKPKAKSTGLAGLGNLEELQKQLADEKQKMRLFVIKAKQEYEDKKLAGGARGETNHQEYYAAAEGEVFGPDKEFRIEVGIGKGMFSSVFQCRNINEDKSYAVKFVRSNHMMQKAAQKEVELYKRLAKQAPKEDLEASQYIMFLSGCESFTHQGHLAMILELQKCDLRSAMQKYGQGRGLPLQTVAQYVRQIMLALRLLRKLKIIHGDLKPDNILMSLSKTEVKVCDMGSASEVSEQVKTPYMQPRYYRAPEIIIGNSYDTQIDLWSAGVTLYELGTGKILFLGKTNNSMLRAMLDVCGEFPKRMTAEGTYGTKHFNANGDLVHKAPDSMSGLPEVFKMKNYQKPPKPITSLVERVLKEPPPNADNRTQERLLPRLADLVMKCLRIDQNERFTPEHALAHPFFKKDKP